MNKLAELLADTDTGIRTTLEKAGDTITCRKGCFHCCKEPAYASDDEIKFALEICPEPVRSDLPRRVNTWLERFKDSGFMSVSMPKAFGYRARNLWCPLLAEDGTCSVYDRRPFECRLHFAQGPRENCEKEELRPFQKFGLMPKLVASIMMRRIDGMAAGETMKLDHIGIVLARRVVGFAGRSASEMRVIKDQNGNVTAEREE